MAIPRRIIATGEGDVRNGVFFKLGGFTDSAQNRQA